MPVPTPHSNEKRDTFIARCISAMEKRDPDRPSKEIQGMCYSRWKDKGKKGERGGDRGGSHSRPLNPSSPSNWY